LKENYDYDEEENEYKWKMMKKNYLVDDDAAEKIFFLFLGKYIKKSIYFCKRKNF